MSEKGISVIYWSLNSLALRRCECVIKLVIVKLITRIVILRISWKVATRSGSIWFWDPCMLGNDVSLHDDVIKWKHFPRYWPFVRGSHLSLVDSPHKGQWCGALMFSLICAWINGWAKNRDTCDLRCHGAHYEITVMYLWDNGMIGSVPVN